MISESRERFRKCILTEEFKQMHERTCASKFNPYKYDQNYQDLLSDTFMILYDQKQSKSLMFSVKRKSGFDQFISARIKRYGNEKAHEFTLQDVIRWSSALVNSYAKDIEKRKETRRGELPPIEDIQKKVNEKKTFTKREIPISDEDPGTPLETQIIEEDEEFRKKQILKECLESSLNLEQRELWLSQIGDQKSLYMEIHGITNGAYRQKLFRATNKLKECTDARFYK